jgi:hypothetical protein
MTVLQLIFSDLDTTREMIACRKAAHFVLPVSFFNLPSYFSKNLNFGFLVNVCLLTLSMSIPLCSIKVFSLLIFSQDNKHNK